MSEEGAGARPRTRSLCSDPVHFAPAALQTPARRRRDCASGDHPPNRSPGESSSRRHQRFYWWIMARPNSMIGRQHAWVYLS